MGQGDARNGFMIQNLTVKTIERNVIRLINNTGVKVKIGQN